MGHSYTDRGWLALLRTLALLRRLQVGPASGAALIAAVQEMTAPDAYPPAPAARQAAFKHDRERLRGRMGVQFFHDPLTKKYVLTDAGPFGHLDLSAEGLRGLGVLGRDFGNGVGERACLRALLDELVARLSPEAKRRLESLPGTIALDVRQHADKGVISARVWDFVRRAAEAHRKLSFNHASPRYGAGQTVYYEVAPQKVQYQEGHWYLRAWRLLRRDAQGGEGREPVYLRFRLNYIVDDEHLRVWPTVFPKQYRTPPRFFVHYRLKPEIGRGEVSHHFAETQVTHLPDGSAEVKGLTEDVWEAARLLLGYGEGCIVLGGEELVEEMLRRVEGIARNYGFWGE